jgi:outer membrane protein
MIRLNRILLAGALVGCLTLTTQAQTKIALVNLKTVFDGYWKTKQADIQIRDRQTEFEKSRKGMIDDYQKANEDYRKMIDSSSDPAVSAEERDKRKKAAEGKLLEIKEIEQSINQFDRQMRTTLNDQKLRMRENIMREIKEQVTKKASTAGYTLVLDLAAETVNMTPVIIFNSGTPELTEDVLTRLNETAPAGALTPPEPADAKGKTDDKKAGKDDKK